jgi:type IV pilus assembly protein PilP
LLLLLLPIGATSLAGQLPLRDPFRPPPPPAAPKKPRTGLQAMAIEEYRLVGIVLAGKQFRAMVEDKSGIGYLLRPGTMLGSEGGRVKEIQRDRVIIEEILQGRGVTSQRREVVLSLTPS